MAGALARRATRLRVPAVVQVEPPQTMSHDPRQQNRTGERVARHEGGDGGYGRRDHQGHPHTVEWAEHHLEDRTVPESSRRSRIR